MRYASRDTKFAAGKPACGNLKNGVKLGEQQR